MKILKVLVLVCLYVGLGRTTGQCQSGSLDDYNITWTEQSRNSSESMPVGGGDIGCNVWVEDGDVLCYMQRSGSFSENGEYLKLGRVRLRLEPNPFKNATFFSQELKLKDGYVEINAKGQTDEGMVEAVIRIWVEVLRPVVRVDVDANVPVDVTASYENWRTEDHELKPAPSRERFTCFNLEGYPGKIIRHKDNIFFKDEGVLFYHRNPNKKLVPEILIQQQELEEYQDEIVDDLKNRTFGGMMTGKGFAPAGTENGIYALTPFRAWKLKSTTPETQHRLMIATHIDQAENLNQWTGELQGLVKEVENDHQEAFRSTVQWWQKYWQRSWIRLFPDNPDPANREWQTGRNYQLFRYQLGCNAYGEYPSKFNGGNFTFDPSLVDKSRAYGPDWRAWGGAVFTAQNQRLLHWPLLKTGDFEAMLPQFELYRKGLGGAEARVKKHFGHGGGVFSEYMNVPGLALGAGYGWKGESHRKRGEEIPFGDPRANALRGYDDFVEIGVMANQAISYHWESQVEHAYMILEYHRYSGNDISDYIPFIKSALVFFDEHYQKREQIRNGRSLDEKGKLVIYPSTSCESYRGAKNPSDLESGLHACISSILELEGNYFSSEEKAYFQGYLKRLPGYFYDDIEGDLVLKPAESWGRYQNVECPQFYPLFPFNRFSLAKDDMTVFQNTWKHGKFPKDMVISWHQDGIFYARMGMTEKAAEYNVKKLQDSQRRFPTFWGPGHDWVPDHNWGGSGMIGLQEMLMQCFEDKIYLFPAWPKEWDVSFKLHAPRNTTIEGILKDGKIVELIVSPESRREDVVIQNFRIK
ncbi:DUF5703 domain-containing protein [Sunxiuqinia elliptica]|uniref:DUF5703 domain-containing protein n=1 Tax=Sunxiuqinia elliptica TaxID=655355 RepID=A0A1I2GTK0_9BACT|nr:DUF5703 domain-containing protein [Sunxiuqinia elliptica]SFF20568.1 hypothetical protein SAMN05216283_103110 [Sunxiuqinia elliptica]